MKDSKFSVSFVLLCELCVPTKALCKMRHYLIWRKKDYTVPGKQMLYKKKNSTRGFVGNPRGVYRLEV